MPENKQLNSKDVRRQVEALVDGRSMGELAQALNEFFSPYGEVLRVASLDGGREPFFLVDFVRAEEATRAANVSGLPLFGFKSLIVDLRPALAGRPE